MSMCHTKFVDGRTYRCTPLRELILNLLLYMNKEEDVRGLESLGCTRILPQAGFLLLGLFHACHSAARYGDGIRTAHFFRRISFHCFFCGEERLTQQYQMRFYLYFVQPQSINCSTLRWWVLPSCVSIRIAFFVPTVFLLIWEALRPPSSLSHQHLTWPLTPPSDAEESMSLYDVKASGSFNRTFLIRLYT